MNALTLRPSVTPQFPLSYWSEVSDRTCAPMTNAMTRTKSHTRTKSDTKTRTHTKARSHTKAKA